MTRIPEPTRDQLSPDAQATFDRIAATRGGLRGPYGVLLHHPALADRVAALGEQLRFRSLLAGADRELAILAAAREVDAPYEWAAHEPIALREGTRAEAVAVVRDRRPTAGLAPREALIVDITRALYRTHRLGDAEYARAEAALGRPALVELVTLVGYYGMIAFVLNAFDVTLPPAAAPAFPRHPLREVVVPATEGRAIEVQGGEYLSVVDLEGSQVADFVAVQRDDPRKVLSPQQTRSTLRRLTLKVGDRLVNQDREPLFEIVRDDVGVHDLLFCACSPALYRQRFGLAEHRSCRMNLLEALAPYGMEEWRLPDPINLFMRAPPRPDGGFDFHPAPSKAGDRIILRALTDLVAAVSSCPMDLVPISGDRITPLKLVVARSGDVA